MRIVLILAAVLFAGQVGAADKYVDANCGSVSTYVVATRACTGGSATVDGTIQLGLDGVIAGDTLHIRAGTYDEDPTLGASGSSGNYIVIQGYTGERPILRGQFSAVDKDWFQVRNITQEGGFGASGFIYGFSIIRGKNVILDDLIANDNLNNNFRITSGGTLGGTQNVTLSNFTAMRSAANNGVSLGGDPGEAGDLENITIENGEIGDNLADGIVCIGIIGFVVRNVEIYGSGENAIDCKGDTGDSRNFEFDGLYLHDNGATSLFLNEDLGWRNITIKNSRFHNNAGAQQISALGFSALQGAERNLIYNNEFVHTVTTRHHILFGGPNAEWEYYNNTFIGGCKGIDQRGGPSMIAKNNIFSDQTCAGILLVDTADRPTTITEDYNLFYRADDGVLIDWHNGATYTAAQFATYQSVSGQGANSIAGSDPLFISSSDFHLQSGSPAASAGDTLADVTIDYDSNPRTAPYSMGAFEFAVAGSGQAVLSGAVNFTGKVVIQ